MAKGSAANTLGSKKKKKKKSGTFQLEFYQKHRWALGGVERVNSLDPGPLQPASHLTFSVPVTDFLPLGSKFILQYLLVMDGIPLSHFFLRNEAQ